MVIWKQENVFNFSYRPDTRKGGSLGTKATIFLLGTQIKNHRLINPNTTVDKPE